MLMLMVVLRIAEGWEASLRIPYNAMYSPPPSIYQHGNTKEMEKKHHSPRGNGILHTEDDSRAKAHERIRHGKRIEDRWACCQTQGTLCLNRATIHQRRCSKVVNAID
jgi:hypothetical protein